MDHDLHRIAGIARRQLEQLARELLDDAADALAALGSAEDDRRRPGGRRRYRRRRHQSVILLEALVARTVLAGWEQEVLDADP